MAGSHFFGGQVRRYRKMADMTMEELAARCGVTKGTVWHWEKQGRVPQPETLILIANNLDVTIDELLNPSVNIPKTEPDAYQILDTLDDKQLEQARQILRLVFPESLNRVPVSRMHYEMEGSDMFEEEYDDYYS